MKTITETIHDKDYKSGSSNLIVDDDDDNDLRNDRNMVKTKKKNGSSRANKEKPVTWRILEDLLTEVRHLAIDDKTTPNLVVEEALRDYLRKRGRLSAGSKTK